MLGELITDDRLWRLSAGRHDGRGCRSPAQADRRSRARPPGRRYRARLRGLGAPVRQAGLVGLARRHRPASCYSSTTTHVKPGSRRRPRQFALASRRRTKIATPSSASTRRGDYWFTWQALTSTNTEPCIHAGYPEGHVSFRTPRTQIHRLSQYINEGNWVSAQPRDHANHYRSSRRLTAAYLPS
jgi:hypothetical protein